MQQINYKGQTYNLLVSIFPVNFPAKLSMMSSVYVKLVYVC